MTLSLHNQAAWPWALLPVTSQRPPARGEAALPPPGGWDPRPPPGLGSPRTYVQPWEGGAGRRTARQRGRATADEAVGKAGDPTKRAGQEGGPARPRFRAHAAGSRAGGTLRAFVRCARREAPPAEGVSARRWAQSEGGGRRERRRSRGRTERPGKAGRGRGPAASACPRRPRAAPPAAQSRALGPPCARAPPPARPSSSPPLPRASTGSPARAAPCSPGSPGDRGGGGDHKMAGTWPPILRAAQRRRPLPELARPPLLLRVAAVPKLARGPGAGRRRRAGRAGGGGGAPDPGGADRAFLLSPRRRPLAAPGGPAGGR